jgi:hypothetical protein
MTLDLPVRDGSIEWKIWLDRMIVAMITASALVASYEAIRRLVHPQAVESLGAVMVASVIGFVGNEVVAIFRRAARPDRRARGGSPPRDEPSARPAGRWA